MDLSIVTVSWNSRRYLAGCIESARRSAGSLTHEHVVVDNASTDGSAEFVEQEFPGVAVVRSGGNLGFAAANNLGAARTTGRFVLFLNPDTVALDDALRTMVAFLDSHAGVGAIGPRLLDAERRWSPDMGDRAPSLITVAMTYLGIARLMPWRARGIVRNRDLTRVEDCAWVSGACLMVRREVFSQEPWDGGIFFSGEDIEYCDRIRRRGWRLALTPDARVVHYSGRSCEEQPREFLAGRTSGLAVCLRRVHGPRAAALALRLVSAGARLRYWKHTIIRRITGSEASLRESRRLAQFLELDGQGRDGRAG